jgi:hypothetical protein
LNPPPLQVVMWSIALLFLLLCLGEAVDAMEHTITGASRYELVNAAGVFIGNTRIFSVLFLALYVLPTDTAFKAAVLLSLFVGHDVIFLFDDVHARVPQMAAAVLLYVRPPPCLPPCLPLCLPPCLPPCLPL